VFPNKLPGLPLEKEIEISIDVPFSVSHVSWLPYRMTLVKFFELKIQLQELLDKGFIRSSNSPYKALVLFIKKTDGIQTIE